LTSPEASRSLLPDDPMATKRLVGLAVAVLLAGACGPKRPAGPPGAPPGNFLSGYVGQQRVLRYQADRERLAVRKKDPAQLAGACDAAVQVRSATLQKGAPVLVLESLGAPNAEKARPRCQSYPATITLTLTGYESDPPPQVMARLDQVLPTPEGYLRAYGVPFDLASVPEPTLAASSHTNAPDEERRMGRRVTTWPRKLFWVDPAYRDPAHRVRHEGEVEFEAVVGADGRLYRPQIRGGLDKVHVAAIERVLPMWRFEPARAGKDPLPAHVESRLVFRIY
jgi:hypothetical protein